MTQFTFPIAWTRTVLSSSSYLKMIFRKDLKPGPSFAQGVLLGEAFADMMYERPIRLRSRLYSIPL